MNALTLEFGKSTIRIVVHQDNQLWFVAKDLRPILGINNIRENLVKLDEDETTTTSCFPPRVFKGMVVVSESGMYALVLKSQKPDAKPFRKWVTTEVLPSIRRADRPPIALIAEASEYLLTESTTSIDSYLVAEYKANVISRIYPELIPLADEFKKLSWQLTSPLASQQR